jgi:hypothetical protein
MQQLIRLLPLCDPRRGRLSLVFLSGKGLRAVMPFVIAATFPLGAALAAATGGLYTWLFLAQVTLVSIAIIAAASARAAELPLFGHIRYVLTGHLANGWGALQVLSGRHHTLWKLSTKRKLAYSASPHGHPAE